MKKLDELEKSILEIFAVHYPATFAQAVKVYRIVKSFDNTQLCLIESWKLNQNPVEYANNRVW
jgi:hypothetical protein